MEAIAGTALEALEGAEFVGRAAFYGRRLPVRPDERRRFGPVASCEFVAGCFRDCLASGRPIEARVMHWTDVPIATTADGSLVVVADDVGLAFGIVRVQHRGVRRAVDEKTERSAIWMNGAIIRGCSLTADLWGPIVQRDGREHRLIERADVTEITLVQWLGEPRDQRTWCVRAPAGLARLRSEAPVGL